MYCHMKATRSGEFICFCPVTMQTLDGEGHAFLSIDGFSLFTMFTGTEKELTATTVLKHIKLLTDHKDFQMHKERGYTLVLHDFHDLAPKIKSLIQPFGNILYDAEYHASIRTPTVDDFFRSMQK